MASKRSDRRHAAFLDGKLSYPEDVAQHVEAMLHDVSTHAGRGDVREAIQSVYAIHGVHEEFLAARSASAVEQGAAQ